jgi:hypothetical protein
MDYFDMYVATVNQTLREQYGLTVNNQEALKRGCAKAKAFGLSSRDCADTIAKRTRDAIKPTCRTCGEEGHTWQRCPENM